MNSCLYSGVRTALKIPAFCLLFLGGLSSSGEDSESQIGSFFVGRLKYSDSDGKDCSGVAEELATLVASATTIAVNKERKLKLADARIYETPFLFMNGHDDFVFSETELAVLRKYFENGGFLLASGCCTNPKFPVACRREFGRIFTEEKMKRLNYDHVIYRAFHVIPRVPCLNENRDVHLEGLFYQGNLVAILCEDGLCCSFAMDNECNRGKGIPPDIGRRLALNIAIYSLTH
ncbi:MAG TPA: DUF4159 domain-containing protein [Chryseolinea sp.]